MDIPIYVQLCLLTKEKYHHFIQSLENIQKHSSNFCRIYLIIGTSIMYLWNSEISEILQHRIDRVYIEVVYKFNNSINIHLKLAVNTIEYCIWVEQNVFTRKCKGCYCNENIRFLCSGPVTQRIVIISSVNFKIVNSEFFHCQNRLDEFEHVVWLCACAGWA